MAKPKIVVDNTVDASDKLETAIERVKQAAQMARFALKLETVEERRNAHIAYGQSLIGLREQCPSDVAYNKTLEQHDLLVGHEVYRSDCLWLAKFVTRSGGLRTSLNQCPRSRPEDVRKWLREEEAAAKESRAKAKEAQAKPSYKTASNSNAKPDTSKKSKWPKDNDEEINKMVSLEQRCYFLEKSLRYAMVEYDLIQKTIDMIAPLQTSDFWPVMGTTLDQIREHLKFLTPLFNSTQRRLEGTEFKKPDDFLDFFGLKK